MDEVDTNVASGGDTGFWKRSLHFLQESAPKPRQVSCLDHIKWKPNYYGCEYHGPVSRVETEKLLLEFGEGAFLVRESQRSFNAFTLSMNFDNNVLNYKLFYDDLCCKHYVGEKRFDSIFELVQDGLICMYVEKHASEYIAKMAESAEYELSPYSIYGSFIAGRSSMSQTHPRCHNWQIFTFRIPTYCDFCRNFLWGLVQQGVRCLDCGFSAHKRCSILTRHDCLPGAKYVKRMFGVDLASFSLAHRVDVPPVVVQCVSEVERRGLAVEGIYRVSGSHDRMDRLRQQFDLNQRQLDPDLKDEDIHDVAGLLKLYLRLLPLQLVPFTTYKSLLDNFLSISDNGERIRMSRSILTTGLSPFHLPTLGLILKHLRKVSTHCSENKMTAENLSMIFSPTIFCTGKGFPAVPNQQHLLLHFLIVNKSIVSSRYTGSSSSSPF
uniref:Beta-chimaerin n=1 Tax=Globodera rostochiensis TaxID=31243 RepID=A0A914I6N1_GLORO